MHQIHLATKTLDAIEKSIRDDQGAMFRGWLGKVIPTMDDAYSTDTFPFRSHMGSSMIGSECARAIWYGFRWTTKPTFDGRLLRLFNRGHLEEARFIAMLLMIGVQVWQQDENGKQFRISAAGGHFGGSGDGVAMGLPDLDKDTPVLLEFKTSAEKGFKDMQKKGVRESKWQHYVQMQTYMNKMGLAVALYMMVNKNNDELYAEIIYYDEQVANDYINRGVELVFMPQPAVKVSESAGRIPCRWCDHKEVCHMGKVPEMNCRTCSKSVATETGEWLCGETGEVLDKKLQLAGCFNHERLF